MRDAGAACALASATAVAAPCDAPAPCQVEATECCEALARVGEGNCGAALVLAANDAGDEALEALEVRVDAGAAGVPPSRSASNSSSGARRAAFTMRRRPISRCRRASGLRRRSSSVCNKIWKKRVKSSSLKNSAAFFRRGRSSAGAAINSESAPQTRATSRLRKCPMASRQKC